MLLRAGLLSFVYGSKQRFMIIQISRAAWWPSRAPSPKYVLKVSVDIKQL